MSTKLVIFSSLVLALVACGNKMSPGQLQQKLDSIAKVYTEPIRGHGFRDSLTTTAQLQSIEGVKMVPSQVRVDNFPDSR